jgi:hypothetical protein
VFEGDGAGGDFGLCHSLLRFKFVRGVSRRFAGVEGVPCDEDSVPT